MKTVLLIRMVFKNFKIEDNNPPHTFTYMSRSSMFRPYSSSSMNVFVLMLNVCPGCCGGFGWGWLGSLALGGGCCPGGIFCWGGICCEEVGTGPGGRGWFGLIPVWAGFCC